MRNEGLLLTVDRKASEIGNLFLLILFLEGFLAYSTILINLTPSPSFPKQSTYACGFLRLTRIDQF